MDKSRSQRKLTTVIDLKLGFMINLSFKNYSSICLTTFSKYIKLRGKQQNQKHFSPGWCGSVG